MRGTAAVRTLVIASVACASVASCALFGGFDDLEGGGNTGGSDAAGGGDVASPIGDGAPGDDGSAPVNCVGAAPQSWKAISPGPLPGRDEAAIFWTGTDYLVFGGLQWGNVANMEVLPDGGTPAVADGGWPMGCYGGGEFCTDGARYNPTTNTWTTISNVGSPPPYRWDMSWAFGGGKLFTFAGHGNVNGWTYDLASDTWTEVTTVGIPTSRAYHASYYVGGQFFVWGGESLDAPDASVPYGTPLSSGAFYNAKTDTWTPINPSSSYSGTAYYATASSDTQFFVWGGTTDPSPWLNEVVDVTNTGAVYNYVTNSWKSTSTVNAPDARRYAAAVWTGSKFVVYGGSGANGNFFYNTGGIYDPATDTWVSMSTTNAPAEAISPHMMVWSGKRVLIWGATIDGTVTGAAFDPEANAWDPPITQTNAPQFVINGYVGYTNVWSGSQMLIWGGLAFPDAGGLAYPNAGALYTPACVP